MSTSKIHGFSSFRALSHRLAICIVAACAFLGAASVACAQSTTYTVNTNGDSSDGGCASTCSLRDAITAANANSGSTIVFASGLSGPITLNAAPPVITASMMIAGPGANALTVSGNNQYQVFVIDPPTGNITVNISGLTIANGSDPSYGGGVFIYPNSTVTVANTIFTGNSAPQGAAIDSVGTLTVTNSFFTGNSAGTAANDNGGAIYSYGPLTVTSSTFSANTAYDGSAIYNNASTATVVNSTFWANNAVDIGGVFNNTNGVLNISNSTFAANVAGLGSGGGIALDVGTTLNPTNDLLDLPSECSGSSCPASGTNGNAVGGALKFAPLGYYGGTVPTLLPLPGSSAIRAGVSTGLPSTDQRGFPFTAYVDAGAVQTNYVQVESPGDSGGSCPGATCTLPAAINTAADEDIDFSPTLNGNTITLSSDMPQIAGGANINIAGPGANLLTISGGSAYRIFFNNGGSLAVLGLTIANGNSTGYSANLGAGRGGAILNAGHLTLDSDAFTDNSAGTSTAALGGAIFTNYMLQVSNSTFSGNTAGVGSAIYNSSPFPIAVSYSTFSGNTAASAGALANISGGAMTIANSTFAGNTDLPAGDGSVQPGSGILNDSSVPQSMTVTNTLMQDDASGSECDSLDLTQCPSSGDGRGNIELPSGITNSLAPLANYGGPTSTILPLPGSTAICGGKSSLIPSGISFDQRGFANVNTTYAGYTAPPYCVDAGAVQTNYTSVQFLGTPPYVGNANTPGTAPPVVVSVTENGQNIGAVPVTLSFSGTGTATGVGPATTVAGTGATFSSLEVTQPGSDNLSVVPITVVGGDTLSAGPVSLNILPAGAATTVIASAPAAIYSPAAQPVTLTAKVNSTAGTVNQGTVTFTVKTSGGVTVGTPVSAAVSAGAASASYTLPAGLAIGTYTIEADYSDIGGTFGPGSGTSLLTVNPITYTLTTASSNPAWGTVTPVGVSSYNAGSTVNIGATPASGYYFTGWTPTTDITAPSSMATTITMNANESVTANFAAIPSFVVTVSSDTTTGTAANCPEGGGGTDCSLRDALAAAMTAGAGNITFASADFAAATTITLVNGSLTIPPLTSITGLTSGSRASLVNLIAVSGDGASTVFTVNSGTTGAAISNLTIVNGSGSNGGGISNSGSLTVTGTGFSSNQAGGAGGAISNNGTLEISGSTFSANTATASGGGIDNTGSLSVVDSTFSANKSAVGAGLNSSAGTLTLQDTSISANTATANGGGLNISGGTASLANSIVAGNTGASYADVDGSFTNAGGNQAGLNASGTSAINIDLAPLGNYGGPTQTMIPMPGSPAICTGTFGLIPAGLTTDQRGEPNTNTTYTGYTTGNGCVDSGSVQTAYSLVFSTEPQAIPPATSIQAKTNFEAGVTLSESGIPFTVGSVTIPLALNTTGAGTLSNGSAATNSGVATYSTLQVSATGTGDTLTANLTLNSTIAPTPPSISVTSAPPFAVKQNATTVTAADATAGYSAAPQSVTLMATVTSTAATVNEGTVTFTVLTTAGTPTTVGVPVTSSIVTGGVASVSYTLPAATAAGTYTIQAVYSDTGGTLASGSDNTHTLTVGKPTPTITWATPAPITYGTALSSTQLDATSSVPGTFVYTPAAGTIPSGGTDTLSVTFTPTDSTDYGTATATVSLVVGKAASTVTWVTPAPIAYGTALSSTQLDATSSVPGAFIYTPAAGTIPAVGTNMLSVTFTPNDSTDYANATATVSLVVGKATPTVRWAPPATVPYGTSLSAVLDATATENGAAVPGSFSYTAQLTGGMAAVVNASTVLNVGSYTLQASFTPADMADYQPTTATASLAIVPAALTITANDASRVYGIPNPGFTGSVMGAANGDLFSETFSTLATITSSAGTYTIVPSVVGPDLSNYKVVTTNGTLTITKAATTTSLSLSGNSVNPGAVVTLTSTVVSATTGMPTGTVTFYDGSTLLGSATLTSGTATYSTGALSPGATHSISAVYNGDINFTGSTASTSTIIVAPLSFTMGISPASQTGSAGTTFTWQLTVAPTFGTYPGSVTFAATGLPQGATATFSPTTLAANAGQQTVTMSVTTVTTTASNRPYSPQPFSPGRKLVPVALALLLLPLGGAGRMRRQGRRIGGLLPLLLLAFAGIVATTALTGCGSVVRLGSTTGKTAQPYTITVTATSGTAQQTATATLNLM